MLLGLGREVVSIHAPREGCDGAQAKGFVIKAVSIHAPREGCDPSKESSLRPSIVSIHAPREGCDKDTRTPAQLQAMFQFTHPGRGATSSAKIYRFVS